MKCSRRSTPLSASTVIAVLLGSIGLAAQTPVAQNSDAVVKAIAHAVQQRLGKDVTVSVWQLTGLRFNGETAGLTAAPEPGARIGSPARFLLSAKPGGRGVVRAGEAVATVQAVGPAVRAGHDLERGTVLGGADVRLETTDFTGRLLRRLPALDEALG